MLKQITNIDSLLQKATRLEKVPTACKVLGYQQIGNVVTVVYSSNDDLFYIEKMI